MAYEIEPVDYQRWFEENIQHKNVNEKENRKNLIKIIQENQNKFNVALYELEILHEKVNPTEHSSIDSHFKRIIDILKND